jgi:hypothetical protein
MNFKNKKLTKKQMISALKEFISKSFGSGSLRIEQAINSNKYDVIKRMYKLMIGG